MEAIATVFRHGSVPIYINLCVSVFVIATIIDRIVALFFQYRINTDIFMRAIINLVKNGEMDHALKICESTKALVARVVKAGLLKANKTTLEISSAIDEELMRATPLLERRIASLWSLANIATLIGLIGTIFGLIRSFSGLAAVSQEQKAAFLARGISEALNNTAIGLAIAVICMIGHLVLASTSKKMMADLEVSSVALENFLVLRQKQEK
jgi:biopolymer transport protein ExbB